jgi:23S rRNA (cytidine1920-2'-O)/16S rRNA (cytidine1409-2'-O)-methyltransferase
MNNLKKERLDKYLVNNNMCLTRNKAVYAIKNNNIKVNGNIINKPNYLVDNNDHIEIIGELLPYVSKGGLKLEKAIKTFNIIFTNKEVIDIGSSTGGFTDCALKHGAKTVVCIDVGTNQLDNTLRQDKRVTLLEQTDFRNIDINLLNNPSIATIDVSFISITKLIDKLQEINSLKEIICLIKPQFEVGKEIANRYKGIINNKEEHIKVINHIVNEFNKINYNPKGITYSPIKGGNGNIEYLIYLTKDNKTNLNYQDIVNKAFNALKK